MKRLMTIAFAAVFAGGAYAAISLQLSPDVYDYKASVKNPSLKSVKLRAACEGETVVTVKYITTTSLYGYLINECSSCDTPYAITARSESPAFSLGNGHGYLVAANTKDKIPTILPADLLAKIWPADGNCCVGSKTEIAEGYLFVGDGKASVPWGTYNTWSELDYGNSSQYLFGPYNIPDPDGGGFSDAWLDAAGFGLAIPAVSGSLCGINTCVVLDSLSGSVIGGMWLCILSPCEEFLCLSWEFTDDIVSGTWSIKRDTKLKGVAPNDGDSLGSTAVDALVNAAILKINPNYTFGNVVPSSNYTDFPRF